MFSCATLSRLSSQLSPSFRRSARSSASPSPSSVAAFSSFASGSENYRQNQDSGTLFHLFLRSISSGVVVAAASLGFCYCSDSFLSLNPFVAVADSDRGAADWAAGANDIRKSIPHKKPRFIFGESYRRRVFFNYEKRIRTQSPPEKVFEYFASHKTAGGETLMTPADLMRAIVPVFPPSESDNVRAGFLRGETALGELHCPPSEFFMLFDTNNDGLISFPEYMFFVTLLKIPESSFSVAFKMFDLNNDGEIDREEFKKVMSLMRAQNRSRKDGRSRLGFKAEPVDDGGGLLEHFFGKDGKSRLKHQKFVQFLRDLQDEILKLEFAHYDFKSNGTISGKDFALSLVAAADIGDVNKLLDLVEELDDNPRLRDVAINFKEFKDFAELRRELQSFSLAIISYGRANGTLTKRDFQRAASQVCGIEITDNVIDIIFHLFDANRDGSLSSDEFVRVLERRVGDDSRTRDPAAAGGTSGLLSCLFSCAANCSSSKLF